MKRSLMGGKTPHPVLSPTAVPSINLDEDAESVRPPPAKRTRVQVGNLSNIIVLLSHALHDAKVNTVSAWLWPLEHVRAARHVNQPCVVSALYFVLVSAVV